MNALYFVFANDPKHPLDELKHEDAEINRLMNPLDAASQIRNVRDSFASLEIVTENLQNYRKDLILFHYSGHAGVDMLGLEGGQARATGIAQQLAACKQLRVVVLNGCATHGQVEGLHALGIPAVLATYRPVNDARAAQFAIHFYSRLARQQTLQTAFEDACNYITSREDSEEERFNTERGLALRHKSSGEMCWALLFKPGSEQMADWTLIPAAPPPPPPPSPSNDFVKKIRSLVAHDKMEDALNQMFTYSETANPDVHDQIAHLSGEWKQLSKKTRIGIISTSDASVERNKIVSGILDLLQELTRTTTD